jgi:hypothetical protein
MSDCIIWTGALWAQGRYGMQKLNGKSMGAHKAEWIKKFGDVPKGLVVCHSCDNGLCVNVDHLFLGTLSDNMRDCSQKGRLNRPNQKGALNNNAHSDYFERNIRIRERRLEGATYSMLKTEFGIKSNGHLRCILLKGIE